MEITEMATCIPNYKIIRLALLYLLNMYFKSDVYKFITWDINSAYRKG